MPRLDHPAQLSFFQDSEAQILRERAAAVVWVKSRMARYGITEEDLVSAGCFGEVKLTAEVRAQYRDAAGHSWNGEGAIPEWLQRAINAGQSVEHFKVA